MVQGFITGKHILANAGSIVRGYGLRPWLRFLWSLVWLRRTTFLELVWAR